MNILVLGGTGTVGSCVVRELLARGARVAVLTRDPEKARVPHGVTRIRGNLLEPETVRTVFRGFDGVFMLNPVSTTETHEGLMGILGAQQAGVQRFVYQSIHRVDQAPHFPHFGAKRPLESALKESGMGWTIVRPNNFFQNEAWFRDAILKFGVYPQPIGSRGLSRIDARDIAAAAAIALTESGHAGKVYELAGPDALTGPDTAALWSEALGRQVVYGGDDLERWEQHALATLPPWMVYDFRLMYGWFQSHGLVATAQELAALTTLLGRPPRSFRAFVRELAGEWTAETKEIAAPTENVVVT